MPIPLVPGTASALRAFVSVAKVGGVQTVTSLTTKLASVCQTVQVTEILIWILRNAFARDSGPAEIAQKVNKENLTLRLFPDRRLSDRQYSNLTLIPTIA